MRSRLRGNKKARFGEGGHVQGEGAVGGGVGRGRALQGRVLAEMERGPECYGRGQGDGRGHLVLVPLEDGTGQETNDGMGQDKDGMDGEMALHGIPTIGDDQDQAGHWKQILG